MNFNGKHVVVTGGTRGIGAAIAKIFVAEGANVICTGRQQADLDALQKRAPDNLSYVSLDLESQESVMTFTQYLRDYGSLDVLVNNAGINKIDRIENVALADFRSIMEVNVNGPLQISKIVGEMMRERGGRIVNIASIWSNVTREGRVSYSTSKAALVGLTRSLAVDLASSGVLVNAVSPGFTATELTANSLTAEEIADLVSKIPCNRMAEPREIAEFVLFLCSGKNTYITGQNFVIDGGFSIV